MTFPSRLWSLMLAGSLALGGCAVVPVDEYGYYEDDYGYYERDTVIVTPPPRVEYRGLPPAASYIWIDGYWSWGGHRHDWVPGYWAPPGTRSRAIVQHRQFERHRDNDRRERWWGDGRRDRDGDRRREDGRRDERADDRRDDRRGDWRNDINEDRSEGRSEGRRGERTEAIRDRDGVPDRDARRDRSEARERERRVDQNEAQPGTFTRPQLTPRERLQAESQRQRLENMDVREERRSTRRDEARGPDGSEGRRWRGDGERAAPGERRGDERGRSNWPDRMRETMAN